MSKHVRCCLNCKYFCAHPSTGPYSDYTPGEDAAVACTADRSDTILNYTNDSDEIMDRAFLRDLAAPNECPGFELDYSLAKQG